MKKAGVALVLAFALILAASTEFVEPSPLPRPLSGFPYEASSKSNKGRQPTVKCKPQEECCVFGSNPKTDCRMCSVVCP